jgi:ABC-type dipeptide/oligopeptide/nickel transport system permease component
MIPTLFGVTIVSFVIMQLAPGDPVQAKLSAGGTAGQSSQNREAYLIQKRDLKLDKPLLFNYRYFQDYRDPVAWAARYRVMTTDELAAELAELAKNPNAPENAAKIDFLRSLRPAKFWERLSPPNLSDEELAASDLTRAEYQDRVQSGRRGLADAIKGLLIPWCEDAGIHGVPAAIDLLRNPETPPAVKAGATQCLTSMLPSPFVYTFPREPEPNDESRLAATWGLLWKQQAAKYSPLDHDRKAALQQRLEELAAADRTTMFEAIQSAEFTADDVPFFVEILLGDAPRAQKAVAAEFARLYVSSRIQLEAAASAPPESIEAVAENWIAYYDATRDEYEFSVPAKIAYGFVDTQYAHMVWRLVTFRFGRSTLRTREPVSERIWDAAVVSVPLMLMAQIVIYLIAVPAGVTAAANRNTWIDRSISLVLFLLYSVPPFVAGMLFLLFFCYGDYLKWFPMERLHSPGAERFGFGEYVLDYLWHAILPVVCLSLFSVAALAMYGRNAMLDVLDQDYIRTARAKGLPARTVILRHAVRNGLIPFITLFASFIPGLLGGSVLIEYLFNIPGMGRLFFVSILQKDFPTLMALIYIDAIVVMLSILMTDLMYVFADPRISFEGRGGSG